MALPIGIVPKDFPHRLKTVLRVLGISQTAFAQGVDATPQTVSAWCRRKRGTTPSRLYLKEIDRFVSGSSVDAGKYLRGETDLVPQLILHAEAS